MRPFAPGSSPLTRGKRRVFRRSVGVRRLIPAHAGKTSSPQCTRSACAAHPRSRGENCCASLSKDPPTGSSPLTRGKRSRRYQEVFARRLIPAHAGKTRCDRRRGRSYGAHPRSRGENSFAKPLKARENGSSPLTRGKHLLELVERERGRLIPAHAGKTGAHVPRGES